MKKPKKQTIGNGTPPAKLNGNDTPKGNCLGTPRPGAPNLQGNDELIQQVYQIIAETPEVRAENVEPLLEALASGTYEVDARKVANSLIAELILKR
jgi:hypothetical protein